jgi:hypothetical protein
MGEARSSHGFSVVTCQYLSKHQADLDYVETLLINFMSRMKSLSAGRIQFDGSVL